ncbi:MAG TPA: contractile injection system protein, VgrG/Pvc8 family, partial [Candidatus Nanopelagicales bacterium]|nr:contractile injection system protein, VgrG/Pvc8 family [Candidatus Nanopelagicales bacterium]
MPIARPFWDPEHEEAARGAGPQAFGHDFHLSLGPISEEEITVVSFRATEAVNELYEAEILFVLGAETHADPLTEALGSRARLTFPSPERPRVLHGIAADLALVGAHLDRRVYAARVVPEIWRLTRKTDTRVFQDQTVAQIVAELLGEHHIPHVARLS